MANLSFGKDLSHDEISNLYSSGKIEEKSFSEVKLTKVQKESILKKIHLSAVEITEVWPDTVLEGPYQQLGTAQLDESSIQAIFYKQALIGFSAYTYAPAAFTDECSFDYDIDEETAEENYNECLEEYKGSLSQMFLTDKNGALIEDFNEPADFDN
jgi:hypothetical protein